nr:hypothetical protein Hi04_10k_c5016_00024 [uncultured bacterium]
MPNVVPIPVTDDHISVFVVIENGGNDAVALPIKFHVVYAGLGQFGVHCDGLRWGLVSSNTIKPRGSENLKRCADKTLERRNVGRVIDSDFCSGDNQSSDVRVSKGGQMKAVVLLVLLCGITQVTDAFGHDRPLPGGWRLIPFVAANQYRMGIDREIRHGGKSAAFLESHAADSDNNHHARLEQALDATKYRGKRLRLSAYLKSKDVEKRAFLAANVPNPWQDLSDFATQKPLLEGTTDWTRYEIEFKVIDYAKQIEIRVELHGSGRVWVDDLHLEVLGDTGEPSGAEIPKVDPLLFSELANTDFEQTELEYQLGLMQGMWETNAPLVELHCRPGRTTLLVEGNRQTYSVCDSEGKMLWQVAFDFEVERSGRISLITRRNPNITSNVSQDNHYPEHWPGAFPFTVNRRQFVQILQALDGSQGPPVLQRWDRVEK